jgi:putative flippase GtrA
MLLPFNVERALRIAILIPAFKPGPEFPSFVAALIARGASRIVVVDDGSGPEFRAGFDEVAALPQVRVCRHAINLGKGAALKTGVNSILCDYADTSVVVTADADGQHAPEDVLAVGAYGEAHPDVLVLGARSFGGGIPLRSRFGNEATRLAMRIVVGERLTDTQTGLRAIPYALLPALLKTPTNGYEFELDMLLTCKHKNVAIHEVPIRTIYLNDNASSHFNPLRDSMRIYFVLLRFALTSMSTAIIDNVTFVLLFHATGGLAVSQAGARLVAMTFNFVTVKRLVFQSRGHRRRQLLSYITLVVVSGTASFGLIRALVAFAGMGVLPAKLLAEGFLFFGNFLIQRDLIFRDDDKREREEAERQLRSAAAFVSEN